MASVWTQEGHSPLCSDTQQGVSNNELITGVGQNMLTEPRVLYIEHCSVYFWALTEGGYAWSLSTAGRHGK